MVMTVYVQYVVSVIEWYVVAVSELYGKSSQWPVVMWLSEQSMEFQLEKIPSISTPGDDGETN